jgi:hypothetical protein
MSEHQDKEMKDDSASGEDQYDKRMQILNLIESGEIDVEEGLKRMQGEKEEQLKRDVLDQLESGDVDVSEAIRLLEGSAPDDADSTTPSMEEHVSPTSRATGMWRSWWLLIPALGLAFTAFGGWLGSIGGWWWLCAAPSLLVGILLLLLAVLTQNSPWLHVRIDTGQESWPRHVAFSFPVPIRLASWGLRKWGHYARGLDVTAVDELLLSLEGNITADNPIHIEVDQDEETGERIQVFLG